MLIYVDYTIWTNIGFYYYKIKDYITKRIFTMKIYLSPPNMGGTEIKYINRAFDTNWIAPNGPELNAFEKAVCEYINMDNALAVSSGTAAIHLALRWLGIKQGDYLFCSDFTFIGSCEAVLYEKATPIFIDSEPDTWNMSPVALEKAFIWAKKENKLPKAVIIVDLYGESADWDALIPLCKKYGVPILEDAAEAIGATYKGKKCGSFGDISIFSFNGNKLITTSGGGMVLSNNKAAIDKMRFWSTQARENFIHYEHCEYGYNYRLSNICAAIGLGQMEFLQTKLDIRSKIHKKYVKDCEDLPVNIKEASEKGKSNYWLNLLMLNDKIITPEQLVTYLQQKEIEARPVWKPMHMQPLFKDAISFSHYDKEFLDEILFYKAVCLPSGDGMSNEQQQQVINEIRKAIKIYTDNKNEVNKTYAV